VTEQGSNQLRLAELRAKPSLSDDEFAELVRLSPPGSHVQLPHLNLAGLQDLEQALANVLGIGDRTKHAFDAGFYVEVIALRSQSAELFLRLYLAAKAQPPTPFHPDDRRPLGVLIGDAEKVGFDADCVRALRAFNNDRRAGLHRFLLGAASYECLRQVCEASAELTKQVAHAIGRELGVVLNPPAPSQPPGR
jgi:hypothetical protein